jgi:transmembrane sensor
MTPQEFKKLLDKFSVGACTPAEEKFILDWYDKIGSEKNHEISEDYRIVVEAKMWSRLQQRLGKPDNYRAFRWAKIAAAITIFGLAGIGAWLFSDSLSITQIAEENQNGTSSIVKDGMISMINTTAASQLVKLNDGTEVSLEPNSEIQYPKAFGSTREIYLKGEAFFKVKRDTAHPFVVYSNEVVTRVLGTSFTVKAYEGSKDITVSVKTGRVSVSKNSLEAAKNNTREVILIPNQQAVYDRQKDEVVRQLVDRPEIVKSLDEQMAMNYDGVEVVKIFDALEELYGVDINFDEDLLKNCVLTTTMKEEGLFERIKVICEAIGARYEVQETKILITSEGCIN